MASANNRRQELVPPKMKHQRARTTTLTLGQMLRELFRGLRMASAQNWGKSAPPEDETPKDADNHADAGSNVA